jgi:hypothetical protein
MGRIRPIDLVDVLVYLVVLGLYIQFAPQVISESFALALLTAILLKAILEVVLVAKKAAVGRLRTAQTPVTRVLGALLLLAVMAGSKFIVLAVTDIVFGGAVQLGGFFAVTALILSLIAARALTRRLLVGEPTSSR